MDNQGERFERLARAEDQKSGWAIVVVAIAALVIAVLALTFAYGSVQKRDDKRFSQFEQQVKDGKTERERLNREVEALKGALTDHNVPIPPAAVDTGPVTTTTAPRSTSGTSSRLSPAPVVTTTPTSPPSTTTTTRPSSTTTTTTPPPPVTTPPPPPPPTCVVPVTLPTGGCIGPNSQAQRGHWWLLFWPL